MNWRYIESGYADAFTNMAVDEAIMNSCQKGLTGPTLRFYGWNPPGVSIGYFQKPDDAVNIEICKNLGINVVRRLTGGRAVLHEHELTYSIVIGENYPDMPKSVVESYKFICRGIIEGLKLLGIKASMESGRNKAANLNSSACFDSASMYEIMYEGKKLVGSAQVRKNGVILQHGSILTDIDIEKLGDVLRFKSQEIKDRTKKILDKNVTTLNKITGGELERSKLVNSIVKGFEKVFEVECLKQDLSDLEGSLTQGLIHHYKWV